MNILRGAASNVTLMHPLLPFLCLGLTATAALAKTPTVLVLGDSLSAGYGLTRSEAYPALLSKKAEAAGGHLIVMNAGVSGDTTNGGLRRLPHLLQQHRIDVLVLELGINDAFRGVPAAQIEANLQAMIDLARQRYPQVRIVIAGMQLPVAGAGDYLAQFGALYPRLAARNNAELVPFLLEGVAGDPSLNLNDMIHPNARGQKVLAANVWPVLERVLRNRAPREWRSLGMDPADPHNLHDTADQPVLERIDIATEGNDCDECVRALREPLMKIDGVKDVLADPKSENVWVTFDARKTHAPTIHDAILKSGYKPAPVAD